MADDLKPTKMVIKVDLQCSKCYRKIKKVLCRYPQIRDQVYDEKQNTVTITVVCCSPEKIKEKIACKAGDTVESIEIVPDKPKELPKPEKPKVVFTEPPKVSAKPPAPTSAPSPAPPSKAPAPAPGPAPAPAPPSKAPAPAPPPKAPAPTPVPPPKAPDPSPIQPPSVVQGFPPPGPIPMYPLGVCCCCYEGGPCYHGRRPMCYDGCGRPAYECSGGNRGYYVSRCDEYFSEENASGCSVM